MEFSITITNVGVHNAMIFMALGGLSWIPEAIGFGLHSTPA